MVTDNGNSFLSKNYTDKNGGEYQSGLYIPNKSNGAVQFLYAGVPIYGTLNDANTYIRHDGLVKAKWLEVNGETGYFYINYESGRKAVTHAIDGTRYFVDDENNGYYGYMGCFNGDMRIDLNDSRYFVMRDNLHYASKFFEMLTFTRHDPNSSGSQKNRHCFSFNGSIWCYGIGGDNINNTIYIQGYEVATNASDERLKDNKEVCKENALDILNSIEMISFDWKEDIHTKNAGKHIPVGYGAQRTKEAYDPAVVYNQENDTYQMDLLNLSALHTKAIQELNKKIEKRDKVIEFLAEKLNCKDEVLEMLKEGE